MEIDGGNGNPAQWHRGGYGNNNAQLSYPVDGFSGKGAEIFISQYGDGDAKWYVDDVPVIPGEQYALSDRYKSTTTSYVTVRYAFGDGTFSYVDVGSPVASSSWQQFSTNIVPPAGAVSLTVFHLLQAAGTLTVDSFNLHKTGSGPQSDAFTQGYVTLSFDDGWSSHYRNVFPILQDAGIKGSFYVVTDEARLADDQEINDPNAYLTFAKLLEMHNAGHEVTAHTRTHASLIGLTQQQAMNEVQGSRNDLLDRGFTPVDTFAYPYGDFNASAIQTVQNSGFIGARGVNGGYNTKAANKYALEVQNVFDATTAAEMQGWIDHAVQTKTWLIMVFHQVDTLPPHPGVEEYSTTSARLQTVANYLKNNNIPVVTTHQGVQMLP